MAEDNLQKLDDAEPADLLCFLVNGTAHRPLEYW
jgi:hypothetical protein